jgi:hypothetical protein
MTKNICPPFGLKYLSIALLGLAMLFNVGLRAQSIHFNYTDGTNASYNIEDVRKITFDADVMNLHLLDGSVYAWNVSTIGYSTNLNVCYNLPKEDEITIALFDMQGKLILEKKIGNKISGEHQETLDLKDLPQGSYVCRITGKQNSITKQVVKK